MITLITGVPGSSKTLNTINEVLTNDHYQNRPVFYYNIPEVTLDWEQLSEEQAKEWFNLPHGSVVILDECQRLFRPMKYGDKVPAHIEQLETHRHLGIDLFVITQHPKLIDTKVRRLVGRHLHFKRQFGMESATKIEFQKCADDPDDYFAQKEAIKTRVRFPKKLYGVYKSSEEHTHKKRVPKKLYGIVAVALLSVGLIWSAVANFGVESNSAPDAASSAPPGSLRLNSHNANKKPQMGYFEARTPRVDGVPSSAPIYDELTKVKSFPRPQCIVRASTGYCSCYTQQATPMEVPQKQCKAIVAGGYFDPTKPDSARSASQSSGKAEAAADGGALSAHERNMEALRIYAQMKELQI